MTKLPIFFDGWHRRDYDRLTEKLFAARVWLRVQRKLREKRKAA